MKDEIATIDRLNDEDAKLCEELRVSCRVDSNGKPGEGGGGGNRGFSCWTLAQGDGVPKKISTSSAMSLAGGGDSEEAAPRRRSSTSGGGSAEDDGDGDTSSSRKRVFSK